MASESIATLRSLGEDALIERLCAPLTRTADLLAGPGDDCAVLRTETPGMLRLLKTDCVVEGVHFAADTDPERVGWKAAARAVSDFAAMGGGQPHHALVTLIAPPDRSVSWAEGIYAGLSRCAERFGFAIVGGETSRPPRGCDVAMVSVCLSGTIAERSCRLRSGARPGNGIWTTGTLGRSFGTGKHLDFVPRVEEARWLCAQWPVTAMMDLSDGVARDLPRLATRSGIGFHLEESALPLTPGATVAEALGDGEDYELLFTLERDPDARELLAWTVSCPGLALTRIGTMVSIAAGETLAPAGWDAFRSEI